MSAFGLLYDIMQRCFLVSKFRRIKYPLRVQIESSFLRVAIDSDICNFKRTALPRIFTKSLPICFSKIFAHFYGKPKSELLTGTLFIAVQ
jgi:hypothetical protein